MWSPFDDEYQEQEWAVEQARSEERMKGKLKLLEQQREFAQVLAAFCRAYGDEHHVVRLPTVFFLRDEGTLHRDYDARGEFEFIYRWTPD